MNIPTQLTVVRMVLTPLFLVLFFIPAWLGGGDLQPIFNQISAWSLLAIFAICELTDILDGHIARKYDMVTDLGKVLDPFSDVIIRVTYFLCFTMVGLMPVWAFAIIIYREFGILLVRMLAMKQGIALAANIWGKGKAVLYAVSAIAGLIFVFVDRVFWDGLITVAESGPDALSGVQKDVVAWVVPSLQGLFVLSAVVSLISFLTYVVPFIKAARK